MRTCIHKMGQTKDESSLEQAMLQSRQAASDFTALKTTASPCMG